MNLEELIEIKNKFKSKLEVIEKFIQIYKELGLHWETTPNLISNKNKAQIQKINQAKFIRNAIDKKTESFTIRTIRSEMKKIYPLIKFSKNSWGMVVRKRIDQNKIIIIEKGTGRKPTTYINTKQFKNLKFVKKPIDLNKLDKIKLDGPDLSLFEVDLSETELGEDLKQGPEKCCFNCYCYGCPYNNKCYFDFKTKKEAIQNKACIGCPSSNCSTWNPKTQTK
jgi:hypothetical protein